MSDRSRSICLVCAWRAGCTKKYSTPNGVSFRCPDYTEDISLKAKKETKKGKKRESG